MITRIKNNAQKLRAFPNYIALLTTLPKDPISFTQAKIPIEWRQVMTTKIDVLASN
jgi:hypothetical protein